MRKIPLLILVLFVFSSFSSDHIEIVSPVNKNISGVAPVENKLMPIEKVASMKIKEAEKLLGRKLSLKEKIAFKIAQLKIKKDLKAKEKGKPSKGQAAMVLGIIGLACVLIPYGIIASIPLAIIAIIQGSQAKKENHNDGKAQAAIVLGIVTLGLIALAIILVAIILTSWGWY